MKKIILLLLLPFIATAQKPVGDKIKPAKDTLAATRVPVMDKAKQAAYRRISGYRQRVLLGENMGTIARLYSEDPAQSRKAACTGT